MTNFFSGIHRATDALTAARYGLEVTGQNIANANTPGYTRQAARQTAVGPAVGVPTLHSGAVSGGGVRVSGADRLGDLVLDRRVRAEHARSANVNANAARLADIENIFREPSDSGLGEQLHDFWVAWGDVADDAGAPVPRQMLLQSAHATVTMLKAKDAALTSVSTAAQHSLQAQVDDVNTAAGDLAELNRKIAIGHATGTDVNALLDQRDLLLDKLSTAVGAEAEIHDDGTATVTVGGQPLVAFDDTANPPYVARAFAATPDMTTTPPTVAVTVGGVGVTLAGSAAAAEITTITETVPHYRELLDQVAQNLHDTVNGLQAGGFDLNGAPGAGMFSTDPAGPVTAATLVIDPSFGWQQVAASTTQSLDGDGNPVGNVLGDNALDAANSGTLVDGPDAAYSTLIGELGRASASAQQQQTTQAVITNSVDTLHATVAGVSFDEEVSNMLTYQKAFQASSRVLSALDEMLDTLINRTGLVGR